MSRDIELVPPYFEILRDDTGDLHVVPEKDCIVHKLNMGCHCVPFYNQQNRLEYGRGDAAYLIIIHRLLLEKENQH